MKVRFTDVGLRVPKFLTGVFIEKRKMPGIYPILDFTLPMSGVVGSTLTHLHIIMMMKELDYPFVVIFELDVFPCKDALDKLQYYLSDIPDDCGVLQLGCIDNYNVSDNLKYMKNYPLTGSHAYIVFKHAYDDVVASYEHWFIADAWWIEFNKISAKWSHYLTRDCIFALKTFSVANALKANTIICPSSLLEAFTY